ncbi:MAG: hypothetical protein DWQ19_08935 [Crenarchaeota archaeon]|nr:MAG: hypothetical protein DWQ19_08935 [Thermoproteota archaeon]
MIILIIGFVALQAYMRPDPTIGLPKTELLPNGKYKTTYENVQRVFMHLPGQYSIMVNDEIIPLFGQHGTWWSYQTKSKIIKDVPENEPMYATIIWEQNTFSGNRVMDKVIIHIHSPDDLNGAGWDDGTKFHRQGTTKVLE